MDGDLIILPGPPPRTGLSSKRVHVDRIELSLPVRTYPPFELKFHLFSLLHADCSAKVCISLSDLLRAILKNSLLGLMRS